MSKRKNDELPAERQQKRWKGPKQTPERPPEEMLTSRQLQQLLTFNQDDVPGLRHGLHSCKAFLDEIVYNAENSAQQQRIGILEAYLQVERPQDIKDTDRPYFTQLWQAWSFANSGNNDYLSSAICSHFALLLKTISSLPAFEEYGKLLCRTVLQHQHLRLIKRCLDAPKHKEHMLAPSLRLLSEVTQFDGGIFAHEVYKRREQTFDQFSLRKCLAIVKEEKDEDQKRRPAVRTVAARYVLAHLRLQEEGAKIDILKQRQICTTLFHFLRTDPPDLVLNILGTCETQILKATELPRASKASLLVQQNLERVLEIATRAEVPEEVSKAALAWLEAVCSTPSYGILLPAGWYPQGSTHTDEQSAFDTGAINLGLESLDFWDDPAKYEIKNTTLAPWLQTLRPAADVREKNLLITCFKAAPELVHAYFKDNGLQMDPALTNTWIGYAAFLYEVCNLPVPSYVGNEQPMFALLPPQTSVVLDNILPKPLTQKVLSRCLNQKENLISFFAVRILVLALNKIEQLRKQYQIAAHQSPRPELWQEAGKALETALSKVLPPRKDVVTLFRRLANDAEHKMQYEATTRLLQLYLTVMPNIGSEDNVDVSTALVTALDLYSAQQDAPWDGLIVEHLIAIARSSSDMKWYLKHGQLNSAPMTSMLRICAREGQPSLNALVKQVLHEDDVLPSIEHPDKLSAYDVLVWSLRDRDEHVVEFLEQCLLRLNKAPVKYLDDVDSIGADDHGILLAAVLLEQAEFVLKKDGGAKTSIMKWINALFAGWSDSAVFGASIKAAQKKLHALPGWNSQVGSDVKLPKRMKPSTHHDTTPITTNVAKESKLGGFAAIPVEKSDHPELFRWQKKDLDLAIEDHDIDALVLCLCSEYPEIRRQARSQLSNLMAKIQTSDLEYKDQLYILIGEVGETFDLHYSSQPLPYIAGVFAARAIHIQAEPTHFMYPKINQYLMKSPDWAVNSLTKRWLQLCSMSMPSEDDSYWKEVQWVLEWFVDALRTQADFEVLRQGGSFARLMVLYASPTATRVVRQKVIELLYRAALINPMTLVSRIGVLSWLAMQSGDLAAELRQFVIDQCDAEKLKSWTLDESMAS